MTDNNNDNELPEGYELPEGWTLDTVREQREKWDTSDRMWPLAIGGGAVLWGVPLP